MKEDVGKKGPAHDTSSGGASRGNEGPQGSIQGGEGQGGKQAKRRAGKRRRKWQGPTGATTTTQHTEEIKVGPNTLESIVTETHNHPKLTEMNSRHCVL